MNKQQQQQQQRQAKRQEEIESLRNFLDNQLPTINGKKEIHANRYPRASTDPTQLFDLFVITNSYIIAHLTYQAHLITGAKLTRDGNRLTSKAIGTDSAHDTVRNLEHALNLEPYTFRYVEHWC